jgi:tetratricopeptide (TPR) repeat protein/glutathione synthase/RimK-type ligase-like ATP-grasp enzyme
MLKRPVYAHPVILAAFLVNSLGPMAMVQADDLRLPAPGVMVHLSSPLQPPLLKGIKVHTDNPLLFDFILDKGDLELNNAVLTDESARLIKYFLASLTTPEADLWVNLSPYEKDRIIPQAFGLTEMGRDLLAQDYMLKQITASLIYPEDDLGKKFWKRVYEQASRKFGTTDIPVNTFNKVWIVPRKAVVYENAQAGTAYIVESKLNVMLEQDYLALEKNSLKEHKAPLDPSASPRNDVNALGSKIIREIVIPELTREVNEDKNFARLRQVYNSLILATWYKKKIKDSVLSRVYCDKNKVSGVNIDDPREKERIYRQYLTAFKKGVYNYIKEEMDPVTRQTLPRKYFSGGVELMWKTDGAMAVSHDQSLIDGISGGRDIIVSIRTQPADGAMTASLSGVGGLISDLKYLITPSTNDNINRNLIKAGYERARLMDQRDMLDPENAAVNVAFVGGFSEDELALLQAASRFKNINFFESLGTARLKDIKGRAVLMAQPVFMFKEGHPVFNPTPVPVPVHYLVDFMKPANDNMLVIPNVPQPQVAASEAYIGAKDISMIEMEKAGVQVPRWRSIVADTGKISSDRLAILLNYKRQISGKVVWVKSDSPGLDVDLKWELLNFLNQNHLEKVVIKPNDGSKGEGVFFFGRTDIEKYIGQIALMIHRGTSMLLQERIEPPYLNRQGTKYDWNVRVFVSGNENGRLAKVVRVDKEGKAINISQGARPEILEKAARELGLSPTEYEQMEAAIDDAARKAFTGINRAMDQDSAKPAGRNATDYMGVDIILRREEGRFKAYVIELNSFRSGAAWDLNQALKQAAGDVITPQEAARRIGEASTGWLETIYNRALAYKNSMAYDAAMAAGLPDRDKFSRLEFSPAESAEMLQLTAKKLTMDMIAMGYEEPQPGPIYHDTSGLPYPQGNNVAMFYGGVPGLELAAFWAARQKTPGTNFLLVSPFKMLGFGREHSNLLFAKSAVFIDQHGKMAMAVFDRPLRIDAVVHDGSIVAKSMQELYSRDVPLLNSPSAIELARMKDLTSSFLQEKGFPVPREIVFKGEITRENLTGMVSHFIDGIGGADIVVKPSDESQGTGVKMFPSDRYREASNYIRELLGQNKTVVVQERQAPDGWYDPQTHKPLDYNFRILSTWDGDKVITSPDMIEVRYQERSDEPVNVSQNAKVVTLPEYFRMRGFDETAQKDVFEKLRTLTVSATEALENRLLSQKGGAKATGLLGWDVIKGKDGKYYIMEVNTGPVGGISTIERLLGTENKGKAVLPIMNYLQQIAAAHHERFPSVMEEEIGKHLDIPMDAILLNNTTTAFTGNPDIVEKIAQFAVYHNLATDGMVNQLVYALLEQKKAAEAEAVMRGTKRGSLFDRRVYAFLAYALHGQGWNAGAENLLNEAIEKGFIDQRINEVLALVLISQGRQEEAFRVLHEGMDRNLVSWENFHDLANTLLKEENPAAAEAVLHEAVKSGLINSQIFSSLGLVYIKQGRYAEAENVLSESIQKGRADDDTYQYLGAALKAQGRRAEAEAVLKEAIGKDLASEKTYSDLSNLLIRDKRFNEAEAVLREAVNRDLGSNRIYLLLGLVLNRQEKYSETERVLYKAVNERDMAEPSILTVLYRALEAQGKQAQADEILKQIREKDKAMTSDQTRAPAYPTPEERDFLAGEGPLSWLELAGNIKMKFLPREEIGNEFLVPFVDDTDRRHPVYYFNPPVDITVAETLALVKEMGSISIGDEAYLRQELINEMQYLPDLEGSVEKAVMGAQMSMEAATYLRGIRSIGASMTPADRVIQRWTQRTLSAIGQRLSGKQVDPKNQIEAILRQWTKNIQRVKDRGYSIQEISRVEEEAINAVLTPVINLRGWRTGGPPVMGASPAHMAMGQELNSVGRSALMALFMRQMGIEVWTVLEQDHAFLLGRLSNGDYYWVDPSGVRKDPLSKASLSRGRIPEEGAIVRSRMDDLSGKVVRYVVTPWQKGVLLSFYLQLGHALNETGDLTGALSTYLKAIALSPQNFYAYSNLGAVLLKTGDTEGAIEAFNQAISLNPAWADGYQNLGVALAKKGDKTGAVSKLGQAIMLNPNEGRAYYELGKVLESMGNQQGALAAYRKAAELIPGLEGKDKPDQAMMAPEKKGGIDLTQGDLGLETRNSHGAIKFHLDPGLLSQLEGAAGFVPVIIRIQRMTSLKLFLGLPEMKGQPASFHELP